ncbi:SDR family oxidoreductase [Methylocystis sp. MJC1]|jgi:NAD(P)-dependent dehydrogenase (short-subunit alcohol dehydrogenase family)|uniref:SDR family oxidoreductase n=1 Tax=Methylocystis sp. MJC1 TaxID=2654282 RepID=UPI0013EBA3B1|nr:SDR family oxidoreductase [Methylocystis sp. MJC1]KAF2991295.1 C-factor [Methylocystis sp. MJC1]MBU6526165.1 SDR family oxidoreductase [Methylocystis sp. MJC1]UZX12619.1 SDR family oxidoreductase [Methylocystis sp. MJC1]
MSHWLIAGASRGIGLELARQLALRGERVSASVRSENGRAALQEALEPLGDRGQILIFDTRDDAQIREAAAEVSEPIDALVANAGAYGPQRQSALDMDFDGVLDLVNVNTLGPLRVAQAFLPLIKQAERPRIAMISSVLGSMALEGTFNVGYRISKAGLNKIVQCLADDLKPEGIPVISMHPGWVRTDMGGPNAPVSAEDSAAGIIGVIERLTLADTRRFVDYKGAEIDW